MKKIMLTLPAAGMLMIAAAQTMVSTQPQNRNVVLEQYGGMYCVYCPHGHYLAGQLEAQYPGLVVMDYHVGTFAAPEAGDPDFRIDEAVSLANQTGLTGYPAGTVNRRIFPGLEQGAPGTTAIGRMRWADAVALETQRPAPVNIAASARMLVSERQLNIDVEFFYTADAPSAVNRLHIALLQNNLPGPQAGGGAGNDYAHQWVVRDLLTGQWGQAINKTCAGHFEARSFSFILPQHIRGVPLDLSEVTLAVFITKDQQEILNGVGVRPSFQVNETYNAQLRSLKIGPVICGETASPQVRIRNDGNLPLEALLIDYAINGAPPETYAWTGRLYTFEEQLVDLPPIPFFSSPEDSNLLAVQLRLPNAFPDEAPEDNALETAFSTAPLTASVQIDIELRTDNYGYETYWEITGADGELITSGGNQNVGASGGGHYVATEEDPGAYGNLKYIHQTAVLPAEGCYTFRILDDFGDGICCDYGYGYYRLRDTEGKVLVWGNQFGKEKKEPFRAGAPVTATGEADAEPLIRIFPNPAVGGKLNIAAFLPGNTTLRLALADSRGVIIRREEKNDAPPGTHEWTWDTMGIPAGVYWLRVETKKGSTVRKIVIL